MSDQDIAACQALLLQLGYELPIDEVRWRFDMVVRSKDHTAMVAEQDGHVIALLHAYLRPALDKPPEVVVQALVVDEHCRGTGVGRDMMGAAEAWARDRGLLSVVLASHVSRSEAHLFYESLGYRRVATSHLLRKTLTRA